MHGPGAGDLGRLDEAHITYLAALASRRAAAQDSWESGDTASRMPGQILYCCLGTSVG